MNHKSETPKFNEMLQQSAHTTPTSIDTAFLNLITEIDYKLKSNCFELSWLTNRLIRTLSGGTNVTSYNRQQDGKETIDRLLW